MGGKEGEREGEGEGVSAGGGTTITLLVTGYYIWEGGREGGRGEHPLFARRATRKLEASNTL